MCKTRLPHARGGVSWFCHDHYASASSSPRPWGCFLFPLCLRSKTLVFPTPVGVFPLSRCAKPRRHGLPHARGGVSVGIVAHGLPRRSSPRPWGCFSRSDWHRQASLVFPTPVGVFLRLQVVTHQTSRLPHARGGVSECDDGGNGDGESSPRPWGCFLLGRKLLTDIPVFPTPVGVFLVSRLPPRYSGRLPHARGGVSLLP